VVPKSVANVFKRQDIRTTVGKLTCAYIPLLSADVDGDVDGTDCGSKAVAVMVPACCAVAVLSLTDADANGISPSALVFWMLTDSPTTVTGISASLTGPGSLVDSFTSGSRLAVGHAPPLLNTHKSRYSSLFT